MKLIDYFAQPYSSLCLGAQQGNSFVCACDRKRAPPIADRCGVTKFWWSASSSKTPTHLRTARVRVVVLSPGVLIGSEGSRGVKPLRGACAALAIASQPHLPGGWCKSQGRVPAHQVGAGPGRVCDSRGSICVIAPPRSVKTPPIRHPNVPGVFSSSLLMRQRDLANSYTQCAKGMLCGDLYCEINHALEKMFHSKLGCLLLSRNQSCKLVSGPSALFGFGGMMGECEIKKEAKELISRRWKLEAAQFIAFDEGLSFKQANMMNFFRDSHPLYFLIKSHAIKNWQEVLKYLRSLKNFSRLWNKKYKINFTKPLPGTNSLNFTRFISLQKLIRYEFSENKNIIITSSFSCYICLVSKWQCLQRVHSATSPSAYAYGFLANFCASVSYSN